MVLGALILDQSKTSYSKSDRIVNVLTVVGESESCWFLFLSAKFVEWVWFGDDGEGDGDGENGNDVRLVFVFVVRTRH